MPRTYLLADPTSPRGYSQKTGDPDIFVRPWAVLISEGKVVYLDLRNTGGKMPPTMVEYSKEVNLLRRALAETALACIILHNPHLVGAVLHKVSSGITAYWQKRREQLGAEPTPKPKLQPRGGYYSGQTLATAPVTENPIARQALRTTGTYTHGATSFGRLDTSFPVQLEVGARQELAALYGNSIPQTLNVHDNFLRVFAMLGPADLQQGELRGKWLRSHRVTEETRGLTNELHSYWGKQSQSWVKLKTIEGKLRPSYLFNEATPELRGRFKPTKESPAKPAPDANAQPGLLPNVMPTYLDAGWRRLRAEWFGGRTLPVEREARVRGMERYDAAEGSEFMREVRKHNLMFAAGQSGTTSTLFQSALLFGNLSGDDLKTYLMAAVGYLVGGGMHSCHEMFKTALLVGIPYTVGGYDQAIPDHIRSHPLYVQWKEEFADITGPVKFRPA